MLYEPLEEFHPMAATDHLRMHGDIEQTLADTIVVAWIL